MQIGPRLRLDAPQEVAQPTDNHVIGLEHSHCVGPRCDRFRGDRREKFRIRVARRHREHWAVQIVHGATSTRRSALVIVESSDEGLDVVGELAGERRLHPTRQLVGLSDLSECLRDRVYDLRVPLEVERLAVTHGRHRSNLPRSPDKFRRDSAGDPSEPVSAQPRPTRFHAQNKGFRPSPTPANTPWGVRALLRPLSAAIGHSDRFWLWRTTSTLNVRRTRDRLLHHAAGGLVFSGHPRRTLVQHQQHLCHERQVGPPRKPADRDTRNQSRYVPRVS